MNMDFEFIEKNDGSIILDICEGVKRLTPLDICDDDITEINIPASVEIIDFQAVVGLDFVERFNVNPNNKRFVEVDGCVYSADMRTLIVYPPGKECECFEIPSTVEHIAPGAFWGVQVIESVKIGENVKSIGNEAFGAAWPLRRIFVGKNVNVIEYLFEKSNNFDLYMSARYGLVVGGVEGSPIEAWCNENAVRFCPLNEDQIENFVTSSEWNETVPELDLNYCWDCYRHTK